jgi:uncharacterized NAD(P)/FAD-binding protein YdhS
MIGLSLPQSSQHVAIIGGGASGTLAAVHLMHRAAARELPLTITMIDDHGRHGRGVAYSTSDDAHLLNAVAGQMSALPSDRDHLIRWANRAGRRHGVVGGTEVTATTFLSRRAYGRYLLDTLAESERQAAPYAHLTRITAEAVAIRACPAGRRLRVVLASGEAIHSDAAVLATGLPAGRLPFETPATDRVITDPWQPGALTGILQASGPTSVAIIGTGLTMLDLAVTITAANPRAVVHAVSRHGLLPRTHPGTVAPSRPVWLPVFSGTSGPVRLTDLMRRLRAAVAANPENWHDVMCAVRPLVPDLWRRMPARDQQLFLRYLARYWEIHRHLVPPATASRVTALRTGGRLTVQRGRVLRARQADGGLRVLVDDGLDIAELRADWLVNASGPATDVTQAATPLLRDLFATGTVRPDPLRLGIDAAASGAVLDTWGTASDVLFTLGPPLKGLWYETVAVPEIRDQAAGLADLITSTASAGQRDRSGSAA